MDLCDGNSRCAEVRRRDRRKVKLELAVGDGFYGSKGGLPDESGAGRRSDGSDRGAFVHLLAPGEDDFDTGLVALGRLFELGEGGSELHGAKH